MPLKFIEMNKIVNKSLLAEDKFMPEMHLKHSWFTYGACKPFAKIKEIIQKFKETGDSRYIYKNKLDKACFQHDIVYGDVKYLGKRTASDKFLRDKAFNIVKNPKYDEYERGLASMAYKFFDKKTASGAIKSMQNQQLANELHKPIKRRVYSSFKDNIWGDDLVDVQLIGKFNKINRFLLCVINIYSKYAWVFPLKEKKGVTIVNTFQKIFDDSKRKLNKIWVYIGSEFYNRSMKRWLEKKM